MYKFSIISYFGPEVTKEIRGIQETLSEVTGSKGSLAAWIPHITVGSGITVEEDQLEELYAQIENFLKDYGTTSIRTKDFSYLDNWSRSKLGFTPYVVYIKPFDYGTLAKIASFFEETLKPNYPTWYDQPWPYNPHITVAYKDLSEDGYKKAQKYLASKTFERDIIIDNVCLAVEGDNGFWKEFKRFDLKQ
ncbi:MAG TPA: 2'-5' RNA ligase family protein [Candidatus Paceibacterota bacterium]|nr:2'-5' RNA ligase family protein [Candidatus Paceibacterota bacterium]